MKYCHDHVESSVIIHPLEPTSSPSPVSHNVLGYKGKWGSLSKRRKLGDGPRLMADLEYKNATALYVETYP